MKKICFFLFSLLAFWACDSSRSFSLEGNIENGAGQTLYFEYIGLAKHKILDSCQLKGNGHFKFKADLPLSPDFYRLRIGKKNILLGVDSVAHIKVKADYASFPDQYQVEGSPICQAIQELSLLLKQTIQQYDSIQTLYRQDKLSQDDYITAIYACIDKHKEQAKPYIYTHPRSPAAYFALFQRINKLLIFDPYQKDDNRCFAAVATAWNTFYPHSERTKHLVRLTAEGLVEIRKARKSINDIPIVEIDKLPYFDINLPNVFGQNISLSSLEGKVILLDFTAFQTDYSAARTLEMRELYQKYEYLGFEIYQVSFDVDEHFWKTGALNLPWICVRDANYTNSPYARMYNVRALPSYFLIDREGHLVGREETLQDLDTEIGKLVRTKK